MTEHDPDAWWSPVPGGPPPASPPAGDPGLGVGTPGALTPGPPTPYAFQDPPAEPSRANRPRRRVWPWVLGSATVVAVLVGALLVTMLGGPSSKTLTDPGGTVSVAVPRSWYDNTGDPGSSADQPPVLAASNLWQDRWVVIDRWDVDETDTLTAFHEDGIDTECAQQSCTSRSGPVALRVDDHDALEQVVVHPGDRDEGATTLVVLTVWADDHAIELYAGATSDDDTAPDPAPLKTIAASLHLL